MPKLPPKLNQGRLINVLNAYMRSNNFVHQLNTQGVCNGLSSVYAKYVLEGKKAAFEEMLQYISEDLKLTAEITEDNQKKINNFIMEILVSAQPEMFNYRLNQSRSTETLSISGEPLKSSFNFGMVANDDAWVAILESISLSTNEVLKVSANNHTVAVSRQDNGNYVVYNPNYASGFKTVDSVKELMTELHQKVFNFENKPIDLAEPIGLLLFVIPRPDALITPDPDAPPRALPQVSRLYELYQDKDTINIKNNNNIDTIRLAIIAGVDSEAISALLLRTEGTNNDAAVDLAVCAIGFQNSSALSVLLPYITDDTSRGALVLLALSKGGETLDELLKDANFNEMYQQLLLGSPGGLIDHVNASGNDNLLKDTLDNIAQKNGDKAENVLRKAIFARNSVTGNDAITTAIKLGNTACFRLLMDTCNTAKNPMTEEQIRAYLIESIQANEPAAAFFLITQIVAVNRSALQNISLTTYDIVKTDLSILKALQKNGMKFSNEDQIVIAQKDTHWNDNPLKSSFNFGMVASDDAWVGILGAIDLKSNELLKVSSVDKTVAVTRQDDGKYIVYDPNYDAGFKTFDSAKKLIAELHGHLFDYESNRPMGLSLIVIPPPNIAPPVSDATPREFPLVSDLYNTYLKPETINNLAALKGRGVDTLMMAVISGEDSTFIASLLDKGATKDVFNVAMRAIKDNNTSALTVLLPYITDNSARWVLLQTALSTGKRDIFNELLSDDSIRNVYQLFQRDLPNSLVSNAAIGGNYNLLNDVLINLAKKYTSTQEKAFIAAILKKELGKDDAITAAIKHGSTVCFRLLMEKCDTSKNPMTEEQKLTYLTEAISSNKPDIVVFLIEQIAPKALQRISLGISAIEKTELSILKALQHHGMKFSAVEQAVIGRKEKPEEGVGFFMRCQIMWKNFCDWRSERTPVVLNARSDELLHFDIDQLKFNESEDFIEPAPHEPTPVDSKQTSSEYKERLNEVKRGSSSNAPPIESSENPDDPKSFSSHLSSI